MCGAYFLASAPIYSGSVYSFTQSFPLSAPNGSVCLCRAADFQRSHLPICGAIPEYRKKFPRIRSEFTALHTECRVWDSVGISYRNVPLHGSVLEDLNVRALDSSYLTRDGTAFEQTQSVLN